MNDVRVPFQAQEEADRRSWLGVYAMSTPMLWVGTVVGALLSLAMFGGDRYRRRAAHDT